MVDQRIRELARSAQADPDAETRWLRELVRAGELNRDKVELLVWLGCQNPTEWEVRSLPPPKKPKHVGNWVHGIPFYEGPRHYEWDVEVFRRAGVALARRASEELGEEEFGGLVLAYDRWVVRGEDEARQRIVTVFRSGWGRRIAILPGQRRRKRLESALWYACNPCVWPDLACNAGPAKAADVLARVIGSEEVHRLVRAELVPWALGLRDPAAERIAAGEAG